MNLDDQLAMIRDALGLDEEELTTVRELLLVREDTIADHIRLAARQFGAKAEIVAEVLAQAGLGTPPSKEERALIRSQFVALQERTRKDWQAE